jgi:purine-binding chemotaxis protein CheW
MNTSIEKIDVREGMSPSEALSMNSANLSANSLLIVSFLLENERYGVDAKKVREIIKVKKITPIPQVKEYIEGIVNLRGDILPVIDLRKFFHLSLFDGNEKKILFIESNGKVTGIIVDAVSEVIRLSTDNIQPSPPTVKKINSEYINGVGNISNGMVILLDIDKIVRVRN